MVRTEVVAVDTETTGLDTHSSSVQVTHISYWKNNGSGQAFALENHDERNKVGRLCADRTVTKLFFNAKFDIRMLAKLGIYVRGPVIDVMLMAQMLLPEEQQKNLKHLVRKFLKDPYIEETRLKQWLRANKTKIFGHAPKHIIEPYALADARRTLELFMFLCGGMDKHDLWHVLEREMILMKKAVLPMESFGVMMNLEEVDRLTIKVRETMRQIKTELAEVTGDPLFNPNSGPQVSKQIYGKGAIPTRFSRKTGKPKVDAIALLENPSPLASLVAQYRKISKAGTTYLKHFNKKVMRVAFNQGGARTGRFSSSGPNLQNIPRPKEDSLLGQMRRCFVARPGCRLLFIDYKQIELRLCAHFSGEDHMLAAINKGIDLHGQTCKMLFEKKPEDPEWDQFRYLAKTLNFSIVYGTGADKFRTTVLKDTNGKMRITLQAAARYIAEWKVKHPKVMKLFDAVAIEVAKTGGVMNHYGRYLPVDPYKSYVGVNYRIQGTAADFMKMKMLAVQELLQDTQVRLVMTVHDELVFHLPREEAHMIRPIVELMEDHTTFSVPLTCSASIGKNWQDKKELKL